MSKKNSTFHVMKVILKIIFRATPFYVMVILMAGLCHGIIKGLETVAMQFLFDGINSFGNGQIADNDILKRLCLLAAVLIGGYIFNGIHNAMMEITSFKLVGAMSGKFQEKSSRLDVEFYEDTVNLEFVEKARNGIEQGVFFLNICFSVITYYIPYFVFMGIYMMTLKPALAWTILLVFMPVLASQKYRNKMYDKEQDEAVSYERKYLHYEECIKERRFFKETRMWGAFSFFYDLYLKNVKKYDEVKWKTVKSTGKVELYSKGITLIGYVFIVALFISGGSTGELSLGAFVALFSSINTMFHTMEELICGHVARISENIVCVKNYVLFMEISERNGQAELEDEQRGIGIKAENLTYCYPNDNRRVLNGLNFEIRPGESIAIVGDNGAGKSTLVKLISGQYLPTTGKLLIGSVESKDLKKESYNSKISMVSQTYQKYAMKLSDNVHISASQCKKSDDKIKSLLLETGVKVDKWSEGLETMLVREYGGTDLSGGEWQKVAITRGEYKQCGLIMLDEPTAAIDPIEEERLYRKFEQMGKNKTSVIVTHRLGAARLANRIFVMEKGEIVESGSYEQLIEKQGKYYEMHMAQKTMYYGT